MPRGLDTFVGRPITRIEKDSNDNWFVELVGGVRVINLDENFKMPKIPEEKVSNLLFVSVVLSDKQTQMVLATVEGGRITEEFRAAFNAVHYAIFDPAQGSEPYSPQSGNVALEIPPMPEREFPGPIQDERSLPKEKAPERPASENVEESKTKKSTTKKSSKKSTSKKSTKKKSE